MSNYGPPLHPWQKREVREEVAHQVAQQAVSVVRAWLALHPMERKFAPRQLGNALDALAVAVAETGDLACPHVFDMTGQRCDKLDDGHTVHSYELIENGVTVEGAQWSTAK